MVNSESIALTHDRAQILDELMRAIRIGSAQGVLHSHLIADRLGMNSIDLECLDLLQFYGPLSAGRLAELTGLTSGAVTGLIDRLERPGFVRRTKDPHDRRKVIVELLPEVAYPVIGPYFEYLKSEMAPLMQQFSDEQLDTLLTFFDRSATAMQRAIDRLRELPQS